MNLTLIYINHLLTMKDINPQQKLNIAYDSQHLDGD